MDPIANLRITFELSFALVAAAQSGLLRRLTEQTDSPEGHAEALELALRPTHKLLEILAEAGFAKRREDRYGPTTALLVLGERTPRGLDGLAQIWGHLTPFLQSGEPVMRCDGDVDERQARYEASVDALARMFAEDAARLGEHLSTLGPASVLDLGAGSGVWSLAIAEATPGCRVTALDLPRVLGCFERRATALGLADRTRTRAASYHEPLGDDRYDLVMLASVLHLEPAPTAADLVSHAAGVLAEGGHLVVVDALGGTGRAALAHSLYALQLALRTQRGAPHPQPDIEAWLKAAGARSVEAVPLVHPGLGALIAAF